MDQEFKAENQEQEQEGISGQEITSIVVNLVRQGADNLTIEKELMAKGMESEDARQAIIEIKRVLKEQQEQKVVTGGSILKGAVAAGIVAVVAGFIWGYIVMAANREVGIIAWGIGLVVGGAIIFASGGKKGPLFQAMGVAFSIIGVVLGKYFGLILTFNKMIEAGEEGLEGLSTLALFSLQSVFVFVAAIPEVAGGYDLLWLGLAMYTSYNMLKFRGLDMP